MCGFVRGETGMILIEMKKNKKNIIIIIKRKRIIKI